MPNEGGVQQLVWCARTPRSLHSAGWQTAVAVNAAVFTLFKAAVFCIIHIGPAQYKRLDAPVPIEDATATCRY